MMYYVGMATNTKQLNRFELKLQQDIEALMNSHKVKFSVFLPVLRADIPEDKSSSEYKNKHKAEYLKQLRGSYSVEEVKKMLEVLGYEITFTAGKRKIDPVGYAIPDVKVKYTELMAVCELLGITIEWTKHE